MWARAKLSVWWPGFNKDLERFLASCMHCRYMGKSQSREPLSPTPCPTYSFEPVVANHFDYGSHQCTSIAERFSGWLEVCGGGCGTGNFVQACKDLFTRFGVPTEISADGGPAFTSQDFRDFITAWAISHSVSSVGYPQSNWRAELTVKAAKRIIETTPDPPVVSAQSTPFSTPVQKHAPPRCRSFPSSSCFRAPAAGLDPMTRDTFKVSNTWIQAQHQREIALARKKQGFDRGIQYHSSPPYPNRLWHACGICQNQRGDLPTRWGKTGLIIEAKAHRQYTVKMDGSGRITTRNWRFLSPISPNYADTPHSPPTVPGHPTPPQPPNNHVEHQPNVRHSVMNSEDDGISCAHSPRIATTSQYPCESATDTSSPTGRDNLNLSLHQHLDRWPARMHQASRRQT